MLEHLRGRVVRAWVIAIAATLVCGCVPPSPPPQVAMPDATSTAAIGKRIVYNGAGFTLPDGTMVAADADSGFTLPNGARVIPDGAGGVLLTNGVRCGSDGAQGYICP